MKNSRVFGLIILVFYAISLMTSCGQMPKNDSEGSPVSSNTFYDKLQYSVASEPTKPQGFNLNDSDGEFTFDPSGI